MVLSLDARDLRFAYPGGRTLLDGVTLGVAPGEALCLLGPNGTGKTTLLRCLLGLETVRGGSIRVDGSDLASLSPVEAARRMAYVPQNTGAAFPFQVFDVVLMGRTPHLRFLASPTDEDRHRCQEALARLGIAHLARRLYHELSGGERQMVLLARALAQGAPILIMDEPCAGLDLGNQVQLLRTIRDLAGAGYSIVLTTHLPDHAFALGGPVALLKDGRLQGPAATETLLTPDRLAALYDTPVEVIAATMADGRVRTLCVPVMSNNPG